MTGVFRVFRIFVTCRADERFACVNEKIKIFVMENDKYKVLFVCLGNIVPLTECGGGVQGVRGAYWYGGAG